jgi:predicted deacylase
LEVLIFIFGLNNKENNNKENNNKENNNKQNNNKKNNFKIYFIVIIMLSMFIVFTISLSDASASATSSSKIAKVKNNPKVTVLKWKTGGNVKKNKVLSRGIPKSKLISKVLKAAKKGTPVVRFGNGSGKKVIITAGIHGSELPSQLAALYLIKKLEKKKYIKGTIYIIPFVAPYATARNARLYRGRNLNSIAHKKNTPSNKVLRLAIKYKVSAAGDFHSSRPGGVPGRNIILGTLLPTRKSASMAIGISKLTKMPYKIEKRAGVSYPGALEDRLSLKGIPAVTCEVKMTHGKWNLKSLKASYKQMNKFLTYNKVL